MSETFPNSGLTPDHAKAVATINGMKIPLREPSWPYPTREPYFPCCGSPVRVSHAPDCDNFAAGVQL